MKKEKIEKIEYYPRGDAPLNPYDEKNYKATVPKKCLNCGTKLIEKRNKVIKEIWDRDKSNLSMKELADIFTIPLPTLYRIIKKQRELNFMKGRGEN